MSKISTILKESSKGFSEFSTESYHLANRKIFICCPITEEVASDFFSKLMILNEKNEKITVYINSPGGDVNAGLLIYDALQMIKSPVDIVCIGRAYSMAAVLLASGKNGHRFIYPHSEVMIHEPLLSGGANGNATSIKIAAESVLRIRETLNSILEKHTGQSREVIEKATAYDHFFTPQEAVSFGLCDEIVGNMELSEL